MATKTADTNLTACLCGCERPTRSTFAPGHDARLVGMAVRNVTGEAPLPAGHWLGGLTADQSRDAIASRASAALAAKFVAMLGRLLEQVAEGPAGSGPRCTPRPPRSWPRSTPSWPSSTPKRRPLPKTAPKVLELPACPSCGAKGDEVCRQRNGRAMPKGRRHAERETVFAS